MALLKKAPGGFDVVNIPVVAGLPFSRSIFLKHQSKQQNENDVLLACVDSSITTKGLKKALNIDETDDVKIRLARTYKESRLEANKMDGYRSCTDLAVLTFPTPECKSTAIHRLTSEQLQPVPLPVDSLECRVAEYKYRYHNVEALQRDIDDYMDEYDKKLNEGKSKGPNVDDDGFTLVQASGSFARSPDGIVVQSFKPKAPPIGTKSNMFLKLSNLTGAEDAKVNKRKGGVETNFYRFQVRKQKQEEYLSLKRKQEQEMEILEEMKRRKKFKPT